MSKFFKKPNGVIIEYDEKNHDIKSLEDRFVECDVNGEKIKVEIIAKKAKK